MNNIVIDVKNLTTLYDTKIAIENVNLSIPKGVRCAIIGPNGAGKSTLMKSILKLIPTHSGSVQIMGDKLENIRKKIAYVPQKESVNWDFPTTVFDVVLMGRYSYIPIAKKPSDEDKKIALNSLKEMNMEEFKDRQISELSGGQKQRVFLARALCQQVDLYMLDEPFTGVDMLTEQLIVEKFKELQNKGKTVISVHHNIDTVEEYFDYVVAINQTVKVNGYIKDLDLHKAVESAYRG